jgi:hypothetical protein
MNAVKAFILFDRPLPKELKKWFLDGLEAHSKCNGKDTLDSIFGYTNGQGKGNAYTKSDSKTPSAFFHMGFLLSIVENMKPIQAARLVNWRNQLSLNPKNISKEWSEKVKADAAANRTPFEIPLTNEQAKAILETYTSKRNKIAAGDVQKDLAKLDETLKKLARVIEKRG